MASLLSKSSDAISQTLKRKDDPLSEAEFSGLCSHISRSLGIQRGCLLALCNSTRGLQRDLARGVVDRPRLPPWASASTESRCLEIVARVEGHDSLGNRPHSSCPQDAASRRGPGRPDLLPRAPGSQNTGTIPVGCTRAFGRFLGSSR